MIKFNGKSIKNYKVKDKTGLCDKRYFLTASVKTNEGTENIFYVSSSYDAILNKLRMIYRKSVSKRVGSVNVKIAKGRGWKTEKFLTDCESDYETEVFFKELKKQRPISYVKNRRYIDFWNDIKPSVKRGEMISRGEIRIGDIVRRYSEIITDKNDPNIGVYIFFDLDSYAEFIQKRFESHSGFDEKRFSLVCDDENTTREEFYETVESLKYD